MTYIKKAALVLCALLMLFCLYSCSSPDDVIDWDDDGFSFEKPETSKDNTWSSFMYEKTAEGNIIIRGYNNDNSFVSIPAEINGVPVTEIGAESFKGNTTLSEIIIPDSVTKIGKEAFFECSALLNITFGKSISEIGGRAFYNTPFINSLSDGFTIVGDGVLIKYSGSETEVTVPDGVRVIVSAFEDNALISKITLPESVVEIAAYSFTGCTSLREINLPNSLVKIGDRAFAKCISLETLTLPASLTEIGEMSFLYCAKVRELIIPAQLEKIPSAAFQNCTSLEKITIPASVKEIGDGAFMRCRGLSYIEITDATEKIGQLAFSDCADELTVKCPAGSTAEKFCQSYGITTTP